MVKPTSGCYVWIGHRGENLAREIRFDVSEIVDAYPSAICELMVDNGDSYYVASTEMDDGALVWSPMAADTAVEGYRRIQIRATVGDAVVKTVVMSAQVTESVGGTEEDPPSVYEGWEDRLIAAENAAMHAAETVEEALDDINARINERALQTDLEALDDRVDSIPHVYYAATEAAMEALTGMIVGLMTKGGTPPPPPEPPPPEPPPPAPRFTTSNSNSL